MVVPVLLIGLSLCLASCSTSKKIVYFQDIEQGTTSFALPEPVEIRLRPEDKISIIVNSRDPKLANLFNLPYVSRQLGSEGGGNSSSQGISVYSVNRQGEIDFPVVGKIKVEGKTRYQVADTLSYILRHRNLVKDPVVTVEYANLNISVMGEVGSPGQYPIQKDRLSILDAISMAGDLTIYGMREKVMVLRQENGVQKIYQVNLCSAQELYSSPVFYLKQDDVVYVEPNKVRARQSTVNGNTVRSTSFWVSVASLLTSIATTVTVLVK